MNTIASPGNGDKNGRVQTWLDGELALDVDTLRLRDYDTVKVDKFYLSTFHGGSSAEWAPTHDCYIRYDNFTVSTDSIATSKTAPGNGEQGPEGIVMQRPNRMNATPAKAYRIDGTAAGSKKAYYEVKVWR